MVKLYITDRSGVEHAVETEVGRSLMEVVRDEISDDLQALCGGCCSCATCHVYIAAEFHEKVAPASDNETGLLDCSEYRDNRSRLSCQVPLTADLDGLKVEVAPEE